MNSDEQMQTAAVNSSYKLSCRSKVVRGIRIPFALVYRPRQRPTFFRGFLSKEKLIQITNLRLEQSQCAYGFPAN